MAPQLALGDVVLRVGLLGGNDLRQTKRPHLLRVRLMRSEDLGLDEVGDTTEGRDDSRGRHHLRPRTDPSCSSPFPPSIRFSLRPSSRSQELPKTLARQIYYWKDP